MDLFSLFKFLHVAAAVIWVGTGFCMVFLGVAAHRTNDRGGFIHVIHQVIYLTPRIFIPVSLAVLVFGVIAAFLTWGLSSLWITLGVVGWAATFSTGLFLIKPRADRIGAMPGDVGVSNQAVALGHELLLISKFDHVVLFAVIADMVFKPAVGDWLVLSLMALAIVAAAAAFLLPVVRSPRAATA